MENFAIESVFATTFIAALVEVIKKMPIIESNKKWCPWISMVSGLILGAFYGAFVEPHAAGIVISVVRGMAYGLTATGLYSIVQDFVSPQKNVLLKQHFVNPPENM